MQIVYRIKHKLPTNLSPFIIGGVSRIQLQGKKILVMGLGLHGGGAESVRYLVRQGAVVSCTDLRSAEELQPSMESLEGLNVRYVLGRHVSQDFQNADIIVKNPAVPADSPWIAEHSHVETDLSLFLDRCQSPVFAVTGSKGKSTTVTALHHILKQSFPGAAMGGNIARSPLSFIDTLSPDSPVVLELSSWQLADLKNRGILRPCVASITNIMNDHQNRYRHFSDYEADKLVILEEAQAAVLPGNSRGQKWAAQTDAGVTFVHSDEESIFPGFSEKKRVWMDGAGTGWFSSDGEKEPILSGDLAVPGRSFRMNCLFAAAMARLWGMDSGEIRNAAASFQGVPYRMEQFLERDGIRYFDDTTATIPDACVSAVQSFSNPVVLIAGGTDKKLDFSVFDSVARIPKAIIMLEGSATDRWLPAIKKAGGRVDGPHSSMESAVSAARKTAVSGDIILLSPGAASFEMFRHEFERGDIFKAVCRNLPN